MTSPREMSAQCEWADLAIENDEMTESQAFSWLCQQWGIDEDEALGELGNTDIYGLLGYASLPDRNPVIEELSLEQLFRFADSNY